VDLSGEPTVEELLRRVKTAAVGAQQHQDLPFEQVVELTQSARSLAYGPVVQAMFALHSTPAVDFDLPNLAVSRLKPSTWTGAKFDLALSLQEINDRVEGVLEHACALYDPATVRRYVSYFATVLSSMVADDEQPIPRLPLMSKSEREHIVNAWNDTDKAYARDQCVHEIFEAQAIRTPNVAAAVYESTHLTYAELNVRANRMAHHLRALGVGPDMRVALCVERSLEMVVSVLAILKAGAAYVPLDPTYPAARLLYMITDSSPMVIVTESAHLASFSEFDLPVIDVVGDRRAWARQPSTNLDRGTVGLVPQNIAYVMYTSGSTGRPKGVMIQHLGLPSVVLSHAEIAGIGCGSRVAQYASLSFDNSIYEIGAALTTGATLHLLPRSLAAGGPELVDWLRRHAISYALLPPAIVSALDPRAAGELPALNTLMVGGDRITTAQAEPWLTGGTRRFIHAYGPTEVTVTATASQWTPSPKSRPSEPISIGRPIPNTRVYVLDRSAEPVPVAVAGELYVGGTGIARGYLKRPGLTAERFVPDPFGQPGTRLYRTGDLVRWRSDGTLEFLGRNDSQVKIRGQRIELGEIEAVITASPDVRAAVVLVRRDDRREPRLIAYVIPALENADDETRTELAQRLVRFIRQLLPTYMVPSDIMILKTLPLNANGKLDRAALPEPKSEIRRAKATAPVPNAELTRTIQAVWSEVLGFDDIAVDDNFFDAGGNSLLLLKAHRRLCDRLNVSLSVVDLFRYPTIAALAGYLAGALTAATDASGAAFTFEGAWRA
jgi:amino acid adenylation domain-containing protein